MQAFSQRQSAFGRSMRRGAAGIQLGGRYIRWFALLCPIVAASAAGTNDEQIATLKSQMNAAIARVQQIVNQTVAELRRTPDMQVTTFGPGGWFHPGAIKPDFPNVDVRQTQEFPYSHYQYVTSDLNLGVVFLGNELEFNSMTKYFYTDRTVPKKRLTDAEMLEVNQLYRVIGRCEHELFDLENPIPKQSMDESQSSDEPQSPKPMLAVVHRWIFTHKPIAIGIIAALFVLLILIRRLRARGSED